MTAKPVHVPVPSVVRGIFAAANAYHRETVRKLLFVGVTPEEFLEIEAWEKSQKWHQGGRLMRLPDRGISRSLVIGDTEVFEVWPRTAER